MKSKSLEEKLEEYYYKIQNPSKMIGDWAIIDTIEFNKLNKITLANINQITSYSIDKIITAESKNKYVIIKYSPNYIATKVIDNEYDYLLKDWDLIAIDTNHLYKNITKKPMTTKEIIKLLGLKLNKKAKKDLDYFS